MLSQSTRPGLKALLRRSKVNGGTPTAGDVGFKLAPRLNAAGRMGEADLALELLMTDSPERADEIALRLDSENRRRREIEKEILDRVLDRLERDYPPDHDGAFVVGAEGWHAGVIGIVASRLVDRFFRPAAVVAFDGDLGRGSCRSIPAVPLPEVLDRCSDHLESHGGHAAAAGFTVRAERFEEFRRAFDTAVREMVGPEDFVRRIRVDMVTTLAELTPGLVREIDRLAPFGHSNPRPVLAARGVRVAGRPRRVGKDGDHLSFLAADGRRSIKAIGFRMGPLADRFPSSQAIVDIAFTPRFDDWKADGSLELELKDLVLADG
jgi:single-stranded-DNA-specific exonuclease